MKCTSCGSIESKVIDSRLIGEDTKIRRRRECLGCGKRFTTFEILESTPILVVKNDGIRQAFDLDKVRLGILKACEKRPVSIAQIDEMVLNVEKQLLNSMQDEVSSRQIGELVMAQLRECDHVAYIRFASVYRQFTDVTTFINFISEFEKGKN